jgi:hypothetical protein
MLRTCLQWPQRYWRLVQYIGSFVIKICARGLIETKSDLRDSIVSADPRIPHDQPCDWLLDRCQVSRSCLALPRYPASSRKSRQLDGRPSEPRRTIRKLDPQEIYVGPPSGSLRNLRKLRAGRYNRRMLLVANGPNRLARPDPEVAVVRPNTIKRARGLGGHSSLKTHGADDGAWRSSATPFIDYEVVREHA